MKKFCLTFGLKWVTNSQYNSKWSEMDQTDLKPSQNWTKIDSKWIKTFSTNFSFRFQFLFCCYVSLAQIAKNSNHGLFRNIFIRVEYQKRNRRKQLVNLDMYKNDLYELTFKIVEEKCTKKHTCSWKKTSLHGCWVTLKFCVHYWTKTLRWTLCTFTN